MLGGQDPFKIGERNSSVAYEYITKYNLTLRHRETGGSINRTVHLEIGNGSTNLKTPLANSLLSLAN
jgi:chemotaxis protein CheD